jgi:predicted DNA binding CopG/RHH family protein
VKYDASAITKISKFFQTGTSEELRAQAFDKISALKDSTQSSLKDLLYKKSNKITVRIASPILELPFKAHNSFMIGESEE